MKDRLSLCMIVKNEADALEDCLSSMDGVVSEIAILDTGSTDDTVAIAEKLGAKIGHYQWSQDFAAARNEALKLVTTEWVLVLDADEKLNPEIIPALEAAIADPHTLVVNLLRHEIGATQSPYSLLSRLFRRHPALQFSRPYHAMIDDSVSALMAKESHWQIKELPQVAILHTGYQQEAIANLDKSTRAKNAMEAFYQAHPQDPYVCSKLGGIYLAEGLTNKALKILKQSLKLSTSDNPAIRYEVHYHLGNAFRLNQEPEKAIKQYQLAQAQPLLEKVKIGAYHNLGSLLMTLGKPDTAIPQYQATIQADPTFAPGYYNLGLAYKQMGKAGKAIKAYETALKYNPLNPWTHQNLGALLFRIGQIAESRRFFRQAIALHAEQNPAEAARLKQKLSRLMAEVP